MDTKTQRVAFGLSFIFVVTIAAVFLFIAIALVPYWQGLSGAAVQDWFAGPFNRFSFMMVPAHFLSMAALGTAYFLHRKTVWRRLFLFALVALLFCQAFNFTLYGAVLNPALQSQALSDEEALATLDRWDFFHNIRTLGVIVSAVTLAAIIVGVREPRDRPNASK
ncbi:MAG: hypothetical protein AAF965_06680 [Pseudomonadota bacterium]